MIEISRILVTNSPIFGNLDLNIDARFNIFSGSSGSGKSVFMQHLLCAFGLKEMNAEQILIELKNGQKIKAIKSKNRRSYFLDNAQIAQKELKKLAIKYISLKDESELSSDNLLRLMDALICQKNKAFSKMTEDLASLFNAFLEAQKEHKILLEKSKNISDLKEKASFEIKEIEAINPEIGEYERLLDLKKNLSRLEKLKELTRGALSAFEKTSAIKEAFNALELDFSPLEIELEGAKEAILAKDFELAKLEHFSPEEILNRLEKLAFLNKKYISIENALEHLQKQKNELSSFENIHFDESKALKLKNETLQKAEILAAEISKIREQFISEFMSKIVTLCNELKLKNPSVLLESSSLSESGIDSLKILLGNADISKLSSGEYSRLRLAIMCLNQELSAQDGVLILDEIDANLSGQESEGVAKILKRLSANYQIFAISHQVHMPSLCNEHFLVSKIDDTKSNIIKLDKDGRINEIARIISGEHITKEALNFAKQKLNL